MSSAFGVGLDTVGSMGRALGSSAASIVVVGIVLLDWLRSVDGDEKAEPQGLLSMIEGPFRDLGAVLAQGLVRVSEGSEVGPGDLADTVEESPSSPHVRSASLPRNSDVVWLLPLLWKPPSASFPE